MQKFVWIFCVLFAQLIYSNETVFGKVIKVKDGDTFVLLLKNNSQLTIRLAYIDCPEKGQAYYQKAKDFTNQMIAGSTIRCELIKKEKYQRFLAVVFLPDSSQLNELLVRKGWAWDYVEYSKHTRMAQLQKLAEHEKLGLWQMLNPTPPWIFRREKKK
jgi:micrococcal nuclease